MKKLKNLNKQQRIQQIKPAPTRTRNRNIPTTQKPTLTVIQLGELNKKKSKLAAPVDRKQDLAKLGSIDADNRRYQMQ